MTFHPPLVAAVALLGLGGIACAEQPRETARQTPAASRPVATRPVATPPGTFRVKPYLQLGDTANPAAAGRLALVWHTDDRDAAWSVETEAGGTTKAAMRRVAVPGVETHRVWSAALAGWRPGAEFDYRVRKNGQIVFGARARAPKAGGQPQRFAVLGDVGADSRGQRAVAYQIYQARPDFVFLTGDLVYDRGRAGEYRRKFFPIYNADVASKGAGVPLLRSTLFVGAPGNHDVAGSDLGRYPDGMAYFLYWRQPLNGPTTRAPGITGLADRQRAFREAAGGAYPRMTNFSFDYGGAHWLVLDANWYMDWSDPALRAWVERDLAGAERATWRFVGFHQPGFNSAKQHFDEQRMRLLAPLFERGRVDIVWSGHVHNYQRTFPLRFTPRAARPDAKGRVAGDWELDKAFDGARNARPRGVIYVITGAGGAPLYNRAQQDDPASWQPFTHKFRADIHSMTLVDLTPETLDVRQIAADGAEIDHFRVTR
jgi:hypothetical protein